MRYVLSIVIMCSFQNAPQVAFNQLALLKGTWKMLAPEGWIYENWKAGAAGILMGRSYKLNGTDTILFETIVLKHDQSGVYYIPSTENQNNRQPITFTLVGNTNKRFVFENKGHDFPQRIIYELVNPDSLAARIEGSRNRKFRFRDYAFSRVL
ncbi:hypothetical protein EXU57_17275 [Segetibacter sp. 3557_3]|uniref:DUF6265 family protein n=1 Tax=Segetibacter sp. 3557_3 TaxID=2547429 RepID=UPI001058C082|nr:DUF6265 family protein [Segetibacter sp. 3557_3]TDH23228.1 hypothetical protein EXU57_17275 [Segetibacter sp. 3557_3]